MNLGEVPGVLPKSLRVRCYTISVKGWIWSSRERQRRPNNSLGLSVNSTLDDIYLTPDWVHRDIRHMAGNLGKQNDIECLASVSRTQSNGIDYWKESVVKRHDFVAKWMGILILFSQQLENADDSLYYGDRNFSIASWPLDASQSASCQTQCLPVPPSPFAEEDGHRPAKLFEA
jgi:hypothetical protein